MEEEASFAPGAYRNSLMSKVRNHRRNFDQLRRDLVRLNCLNSNIVSVVDMKNILGDSMLRTLRSDTKINILNPNLDVKCSLRVFKHI